MSTKGIKTLYATDLDGTLLGRDAKLSGTGVRLYRELLDKGVMLTFITARSPATIEPILAAARPTLPGVAMTGCAIWNPNTRQYEDVIYHDPAHARRIMEICLREGFTPFVYTMRKGGNHIDVYHRAAELTALEKKFVEDRTLNDLKSFSLHQAAPEDTADCTLLFFGMGEQERVKAVAEAIRMETGCAASCYPDTYNPGVMLLEVFAAGVTKANGLMRLKKLFGAERVVVFGDNLNDVPMFEAADFAVAVANAHEEVKKAADLVIGGNDEDAVLRYIAGCL
ncbi:MAG: Cof-type HAD-IIB family hydrolase [Clostridium sp.]|nr:Cof-type HAD-IIB family hydrolase [Clostridium sp.]